MESFLLETKIPILFVSHDVRLLESVANGILHIEQIHRKQKSKITISSLSYSEYMALREQSIIKQTAEHYNEKRNFEIKEMRYRKLHQNVENELRGTSR